MWIKRSEYNDIYDEISKYTYMVIAKSNEMHELRRTVQGLEKANAQLTKEKHDLMRQNNYYSGQLNMRE